MREVYWRADNIISPIADTGLANFEALVRNETGIRLVERSSFAKEPFYASLFPENTFSNRPGVSNFEELLIRSISNALSTGAVDAASERTILILASTKGNIGLLEKDGFHSGLQEQLTLSHSAVIIKNHFGLRNEPVVISNACISGVLALVTAMRMLRTGRYDHAIVAGADLITQFVLSGFQSFQAISSEPCKPFDENRSGITLGEGAATAILSVNAGSEENVITLRGGAVSNDANHISGPSRTGAELAHAIAAAMQEAHADSAKIDAISAHGTATLYNDDMESRAFRLAGLQQVPVNSLKGYYGHTLGAAGLIESTILCHSLRRKELIGTRGCENPGTAEPINVCRETMSLPMRTVLKTGSGFGGCNAALLFQYN